MLMHSFAETIEESSISKSEIDRLNAENERLRHEISQLRHSPSTVLVSNTFSFALFADLDSVFGLFTELKSVVSEIG